MATSLTPLSKGIIGLAVVGAVVSALWHLVLKDMLAEQADAQPSPMVVESAAPPPPAVVVPPAPVVDTKPVTPTTTGAPKDAAPPVPPATPVVASEAVRPVEADPLPDASARVAAAAANLSPGESGEMGRQFLNKGDFAQARIYLEKAVQGGDGAAACHLGEMTLKGQGGISPDQDKAAKLFLIAQSRNIMCFASGQ